MTVTDIDISQWWCAEHNREKEMMPRNGIWIMVCPSCEAKEKQNAGH